MNSNKQTAEQFITAYYSLIGSTSPTLEQIWVAMDSVWDALECDNLNPEQSKLDKFYRHPVWLLNGLFIEEHELSLEHREGFSDWIASQKPVRLADFGGGFGTLARMCAIKLPKASVEIIEPFPTNQAKEKNTNLKNVSFVEKLSGKYDLIVATDVFEHVTDPLNLLFDVSQHVSIGGSFLVANNFSPCIKCHLPCTFHFQHTWHLFMRFAGFRFQEQVVYGWSYVKISDQELSMPVRSMEKASRLIASVTRKLPIIGRRVDRIIGVLALWCTRQSNG